MMEIKNSFNMPKANVLHSKKKKIAFSLIELMISLIAISIISASFAPVISKRIKSGAMGIGTGASRVNTSCLKWTNDGGSHPGKGLCSLCTDTRCLICTGLYCDENNGEN